MDIIEFPAHGNLNLEVDYVIENRPLRHRLGYIGEQIHG